MKTSYLSSCSNISFAANQFIKMYAQKYGDSCKKCITNAPINLYLIWCFSVVKLIEINQNVLAPKPKTTILFSTRINCVITINQYLANQMKSGLSEYG